MVDLVIDHNGFPTASEGRTRHAPLRSRSRTTPQRTNSSADGTSSSEKSAAASTDVQSGLKQNNSSGTFTEKEFSGSAAACASPKRRSPGRSNSSDEQDKELLDLAKAQLALNPVPSLGDKVKMKVIVRKKKGTKDPTRTPSPGVKNRRSIKVPAGALDIAALEVVKDENVGFNSTEKKSDSSRGREILLKDRNARSSSRRSTRSRSRGGRIQSVKINLEENDSDTDVLDDELDEDHGEAVSGGAEHRGEPGIRGQGSKGADTPSLLNAPEDDKVKSVAPRRESGGRDRFTSASEWSNVVDDLVQKRPDEKEGDKDVNKNKSRGLGRLFNTGRKQTTD
ncbi:hypothetical protein FisN_7Lu227 [Fistulifera solaris]|uniref:Uncharacterized protein n=1 Tax=Fistulifera solaris TaxID=1519565 RepID=A0A1Z5JR46_FISSO|nr:hypothetical protein FisN_7Lu227 [Fistulifera solaris]|eukprot:GAX16495.1 hypothetical protein FisN_7Lu227 [Fistulifera solaris]